MKQQHKFTETEIGKIPGDWGVATIERIKASKKHALAMGPFGSNITKDNFVKSGVPVIRGNNLTEYRFLDKDFVFLTESKADELAASVALPEDIVITHRGSLGQVGIIPKESRYPKYVVSQSGMKISCDTTIVNPQFVFYFLKSPKGQYLLLKNTSQTGVPAIAQPLASLRSVRIPLPKLDEQNEIVGVLFPLDDLIELNGKINTNLEKMGQTLFKHWFIDFEFPNEKGKPYKSSGGKMVDSELGEIPEGWRIGNFEEIIEITSGKRPNNKSDVKTSEFNTPLIGASSVRGFVKEKLYDEPIIIIGRVGTHGIVQRILYPSFPSDNTLVIKSKYYGYAYHTLITIDYESLNVGTTQPLITQSSIKKLRLVIPGEKILDQYENTISNMFIKIHQNNVEIETLSSIRDSLLPKLMSGQIRVPAG